jgi:thioredoxin reductase (NADPH)
VKLRTVGGAEEVVPASALFLLIGAEPRTEWLAGSIARDQQGFILTGRDLLDEAGQPPPSWPRHRPPMLLETNLPGVFAVGDVRHRSVKRVAAAAGEGATSVQLVHEHLRDLESPGTDAQ